MIFWHILEIVFPLVAVVSVGVIVGLLLFTATTKGFADHFRKNFTS